MNILFTKQGCPFCKQWLTERERINVRLDPINRIKLVDITSYLYWGIVTDPLIVNYSEYLSQLGAPLLVLSGHAMIGTTTRYNCRGFLKGYFGARGELKY